MQASAQTQAVPDSFRRMFAFMAARPGPRTLVALILVAAAFKQAWGDWDWLDAAIVLGFVMLRSFIEWGIHAYLYHAHPLPVFGWRLKTSVSAAHERHHQSPRDYETFLLTHRGVLALAAVSFVFALVVSGSADRAASVVLGFMLIALCIEVVHLMAHCRIYPRNGFLRRLITLHRMHHYTHGRSVYGVSSTLADRCFGTYPRQAKGKQQ